MTPEMVRFMSSVRGAEPDDRAQVDEAALLALAGEERIRARTLLLERIDRGDWRAPPALAAMGATEVAPALRARLRLARGKTRIGIARALVALGVDADVDAAVIDAILEDVEVHAQDGVIAALQQAQPSPALLATLADACVLHVSPSVRSSAAAALLYLHGVSTDPGARDRRTLVRRFLSADLAARRQALDELRGLLP